MKTLALDPGTTYTAWVLYENGVILDKGIGDNDGVLRYVETVFRDSRNDPNSIDFAIEMIQSYGMPVGREIFETCLWVGRFYQVGHLYFRTPNLYSRTKIKAYVTGSAKGKDKDVRQALMLRFGGTKKGEPLHGVSKDIWSALAVAVYHQDGATLGGWKD